MDTSAKHKVIERLLAELSKHPAHPALPDLLRPHPAWPGSLADGVIPAGRIMGVDPASDKPAVVLGVRIVQVPGLPDDTILLHSAREWNAMVDRMMRRLSREINQRILGVPPAILGHTVTQTWVDEPVAPAPSYQDLLARLDQIPPHRRRQLTQGTWLPQDPSPPTSTGALRPSIPVLPTPFYTGIPRRTRPARRFDLDAGPHFAAGQVVLYQGRTYTVERSWRVLYKWRYTIDGPAELLDVDEEELQVYAG